MHKDVLYKKLRRLVSAGTVLTMLGAASLTAVHGQDIDDDGADESYSRIAARNSADALRVLDDETPPPPSDQPPPGGALPAYENAGEKEQAPEEPAAPPEVWNLTNLFTNEAGYNSFKEAGVKISGHMQWGYVNNPDGAFVGNGPSLNEKQWGFFGLQQAYLFAERVADGSKDALGLGLPAGRLVRSAGLRRPVVR